MPRLTLALFEKDRLVRIVSITRTPFLIGRAPPCDLVLDHPAISRRHVRVTVARDQALLVDEGSSNGFLLNGNPSKQAELATGDRLSLGPFSVHFEIAPETGPAPGAPDRSSRALSGLLGLACQFGGELDQRELLEKMLDCLIEAFEADRGFILYRRGPDEELVPVMARRFDDGPLEATISYTVAREVARTGEPALVADIEAQQRFEVTPSISRGGIRSILCTPIAGPKGIDGVLYLDSPVASRKFLDADLELLERVSGHAARVIGAFGRFRRLERDNTRLRAIQRGAAAGFDAVIGSSEKMTRLVTQAQRAAQTDVSVLLLGESGTGKEILARAIHESSPRREGPFVPIHCAALSPGVVESELFGHEKGAFTGAVEKKLGRLELADGGTLFLDEVGELPIALQVKLLRVLQERRVEPVGSSQPIELDVRLICATNRDLEAMVSRGEFREDLFYRINVLALNLPPLREHPEDLPELVDHFLRELAPRLDRTVTGVDELSLSRLMAYHWPGNTRELRNVIERALVIEPSSVITPGSLPFRSGDPGTDAGSAGLLDRARDSLERTLIVRALKATGWNVSRSAQELGVHRMALQRRIDALGIKKDE